MPNINLITSELFNKSKREKDVLQVKGGQLVLHGKTLNADQRAELANQARDLQKMSLVRVLLDELYYLGSKKIYHDSTTVEDLQFGKAVLWTVDILEQKIDNLSKMK
jgi:hypothetical protein